MKGRRIVGSALAVAVALTGIVSALTESPAVIGMTAAGVAIYLAVGVGLPQYLLSRRSGSALQLGLAILAAGGGVIAMIAGLATGTPHEELTVGLTGILFVVVLGNAIGAGVREFRAGYRSTS